MNRKAVAIGNNRRHKLLEPEKPLAESGLGVGVGRDEVDWEVKSTKALLGVWTFLRRQQAALRGS